MFFCKIRRSFVGCMFLICAFGFSQNISLHSYYLNMGAGSPNYRKDYNTDYAKKSFPECADLQKDFTGYYNDSVHEQFPMLVNLDLGVYLNRKDTLIKKSLRPITLVYMSIADQRISRTLIEKDKFMGDTTGVADTLKIDHYAFTHNYTLISFGFNTLIYTKYLGKKEWGRFFVGAGVNTGIGISKLHAWHAVAEVNAIKTSSNPDKYSYNYPYISKDEQYTKYVSKKPISVTRLEIPMGMEVTGKKKRLILGLEIKFGRSFAVGSRIGSINGPYVHYGYYLRYVIKPWLY